MAVDIVHRGKWNEHRMKLSMNTLFTFTIFL